MKYTIITALLITATGAHAGGLSDPVVLRPVERPTVGTAVRDTGWGGAYAGVAVIGRETVDDIDDIYVRECRFGYSHTSRKCSVEGHEGSPEIAALERRETPWRRPEFPSSRPQSEPLVYQSDPTLIYGPAESTFTYTTDVAGDPVAVAGKDAENVLVDTITEALSEGALIAGHVGYRWDLGAVVGVEATTDGDMTTAELSAGIPLGNALPYAFVGAAQFDGDDGQVYGQVYGAGVDYQVGTNWSVGLKGTVGDFGDVTTEQVAARVSWHF